jgi:membrane-bound acyltransferase YfiQ involved in biofilm formation
LAVGLALIFLSSPFFQFLGSSLQISLFQKIAWNNFLFIRLGDVLVLLALFMFFQAQIKTKLWRFIGAHTLELYIVHYFILYGSITGYGVYKFYAKELLLWESILTLLFFLGACIGIVFVWRRKNHHP